MITYDGNNANMSFQQQLQNVCKHRMYRVNVKHMLMFKSDKNDEWTPYGIFETRPIAEYFEKRINVDFPITCVIAVDNYKMPLHKVI